jgi:hypothetical protein
MAINYSQFPFAPIQKNPMSLLANPAQTAMQQRNSTGLLNLDPMQVQQARMRKGVADAEALNKRQMRGNMFMALGDAFAGREMNSNFLARQQHLQAQKAAEEKRKQGLALGESAYDYILKTTGNADMAMLVKNNPTLANEVIKNRFAKPKDRRIVEGADKRKYYADTGELVFPNIKVPIDNVEQNKMILSERKEVGKNYKPVNEAVVGYKKLEDALRQKSGTAAYTSLVLFMKNLDGSVVKEGEVAQFKRAQGILNSIDEQLQETKGKGMTDRMRADILNLAKASTRHMVDGYDDYLAGTKSAYEGINLPSKSIFSGYLIDRENLDFTPIQPEYFDEIIEFE